MIGSFDAPQGHGMAVDSKGFVYIGNTDHGLNTVRKYDPKTGKLLAEVPRAPENQPGGGGGGDAADEGEGAARTPGKGGPGPVGTFLLPHAQRAAEELAEAVAVAPMRSSGRGYHRVSCEISSDDADDCGTD